MNDINLGLYPRPRPCPLGLMTMDCSGDLVFAVKLLWTLSQAFTTSHPLSYTGPNWCTPPNNDLKWPKIKQVTNSKLYYNKVNRLLSPVLLNRVGPA